MASAIQFDFAASGRYPLRGMPQAAVGIRMQDGDDLDDDFDDDDFDDDFDYDFEEEDDDGYDDLDDDLDEDLDEAADEEDAFADDLEGASREDD